MVQICQSVEGMPLAIELAAAWSEVLTPADIANEITRSPDILAVNWPDRPDRHHSLRAVFDSSWKLLAEKERFALMQLTVFVGSFSRQAALFVTGASLQLLMTLQQKSWLQTLNNGRYQIHEMLRQYAYEKLQADSSAWQATMQRYSSYYAGFLEEQATDIKGPRQREAYDAIAGEYNNVRRAWEWLVENEQVELAVNKMLLALYRYAEARARPFELNRSVELAIQALIGDSKSKSYPHLMAILLIARSGFNQYGDLLRSGFAYATQNQEEDIRQAWLYTQNGEMLRAVGFWGILLAEIYGYIFDLQLAKVRLRELQSYYRNLNLLWELANTQGVLAVLSIVKWESHSDPIKNPQEMRDLLLSALALFEELGDQSGIGYTMHDLARLS